MAGRVIMMGQQVGSATHLVEVACRCDNLEHCVMERYIADVRLAQAEIARLQAELAAARLLG